jgi:hypothetical protein
MQMYIQLHRKEIQRHIPGAMIFIMFRKCISCQSNGMEFSPPSSLKRFLP